METNIEKAIRYAIEGGYRFNTFCGENCIYSILLDKNFWICLGKNQNWDDSDLYDNLKGTEPIPYWLLHWHSFIDALSRDETPEQFFEGLLIN